MKLKPCPWCKKPVTYQIVIWTSNYDSSGRIFSTIRDFKTEKIECSNINCNVRPNLLRINTGDAIEIWNSMT